MKTISNETLQEIIDRWSKRSPGQWNTSGQIMHEFDDPFIPILDGVDCGSSGYQGNQCAVATIPLGELPIPDSEIEQAVRNAFYIVSACNHAAEIAAELLDLRVDNARLLRDHQVWLSLDFDRNVKGEEPKPSVFMVNAVKKIEQLEKANKQLEDHCSALIDDNYALENAMNKIREKFKAYGIWGPVDAIDAIAKIISEVLPESEE